MIEGRFRFAVQLQRTSHANINSKSQVHAVAAEPCIKRGSLCAFGAKFELFKFKRQRNTLVNVAKKEYFRF